MTMGRTRRSAGSPWYSVASGEGGARRRSGARYQPLSEAIDTRVPVCGAWMKRPSPMYMPTWPTPSKKTRSPGRSRARDAAAEIELRVRVVRQRDPEVRVDEAHEAGAVEAAARRRAAVRVADAEEMARVADDLRLLAGDRGRMAHGLVALGWRPSAPPARAETHVMTTKMSSARRMRSGKGRVPFGRGGARRVGAALSLASACQQRPPATPLRGLHPPKGVGRRGSPEGVKRAESPAGRVSAAPGRFWPARAFVTNVCR